MKPCGIAKSRFRRLAALLWCAVLAAALLLPAARAEAAAKRVRVGWHEPPYFITDQFGRRSGYTYDYQRKIAAYTGWEYEYVEGSWSELLRMLKDGEIDLLGNVSYMEQRAKDMLYASLPMGTESYYLFVSPDDAEIRAEDYSSLNGKRVGVAKDSIQSNLFPSWASSHGIDAEIVELTTQEEESLRLLGSELDAFVTMDVHGDAETAIPVWKIGSSDYYFAVSKRRVDLLTELNAAMSSIQDENKYFNQQLYETYLRNTEANQFLTETEKSWLETHGAIRVGYQDGYLAFCAADPATGELIGALKDYLDYASGSMANAELRFEAKAYPTAAAAIDALKNGEVDCVFPANLTQSDSEDLGVVMTPALMRTEMDAVVRASDQKEFVRRQEVTVAVNRGNTNYERFLIDHFPSWRIQYYDDTPGSLDGVAVGEADCVIISNYRYSNIAKQCERLRLTTVYTGVDMDYCLAVRAGDTALYSILAKTIAVIPDSTVHAALTYYSTEDAKTGFLDFIRENLVPVLLGIIAVALLIVVLLLRSIRAQKKAAAEERLVKALNKRVFVDALTSVRNKGAFAEYIQQLQDRLDGEEPMELAIGVFDCDDLKSVNDSYGHDKGDEYLKTASRLICRVFQHSPVFRIGGDEFAVILQNEDLQNLDALVAQFDRAQQELCAAKENRWEQARIALGIARYDPRLDRSINDVARRADKIMYENKRLGKERELRSRPVEP